MIRSTIARTLPALAVITASLLGGVAATTTSTAAAADTDMTISGVPVECGGAQAFVSVRFWNARQMYIRYTLNNTNDSDGKTPKILFTADNNYQPQLNHGSGWLTVPSGKRSVSGDFSWDPSSIGLVHNLMVTVKNGTDEEGSSCTVTKRIWNYSQLARRIAEFQAGDPYGLGYEGPNRFDCSGLVLYGYENINSGYGPEIFPDFENTLGVRTAEAEMYKFRQWANDGRRTQYDAISVPASERQPGDLVFYDWADYPRAADHVAFWAGDGKVFDGYTDGVPMGEHVESDFWRSRIASTYRIVGVSG